VKHRLITTVLAIVASLTLAGSVVTARAPAAAERHTETPNVVAHGNPHASDQGENADDQAENEPPDQNRPHNHGWYVSQAAHDKSTTGAAHGKAVSAVARGHDGKTDTTDH
jgi:hypothetical protein